MLCQESFPSLILLKVVYCIRQLSIENRDFCQKNKYILQDDSGSHLGFMNQRHSQRYSKYIPNIFLKWQWPPSSIYDWIRSSNQKIVAEMSFRSGATHLFLPNRQKFLTYLYFWHMKNKLAAQRAIKKSVKKNNRKKGKFKIIANYSSLSNRICGKIAFTPQTKKLLT